jgi:hypothetical protein
MYDLNDPLLLRVWAGSVGGGLWFTTNIKATTVQWQKVSDILPNLAITTIAQSPVNPQIMYAGTGEIFVQDGIKGIGIYRSTDGGEKWKLLTATTNTLFEFVSKIVVANDGSVLATTFDGGMQRSQDNGLTWTKVLGIGVSNGITNQGVDIKKASDGRIFCSFGRGQNDGIYRSNNNGLTWVRIYTAEADERRIELATDSTNPSRVYAIVESALTRGVKKIMFSATVNTLFPFWSLVTVPLLCGEAPGGNDFTHCHRSV